MGRRYKVGKLGDVVGCEQLNCFLLTPKAIEESIYMQIRHIY